MSSYVADKNQNVRASAAFRYSKNFGIKKHEEEEDCIKF